MTLWYYVARRGSPRLLRYGYMMDDLDHTWEALLSGDPARIRRAWEDLTDEEALSVLAHLARMRDEDGWALAQREAAQIALQVLRDQPQ